MPLAVEFHDEEPPTPGADWDLVIDLTLHSRSGRLNMTFPDDELLMLIFSVGSGLHHIRVCGAHMGRADFLEDEGPDHYRLQVWPATTRRATVVSRLPDCVTYAPQASD